MGTPLSAFDYDLPPAAIAQTPLADRTAARLLASPGLGGPGSVDHATIADLPAYLRPGDLLVVNETRVLPARLPLARPGGGRAEVLLLECTGPGRDRWSALVRPGRRLPPGTVLVDPAGPPGEGVVRVGERLGDTDDGRRAVEILDLSVIERLGRMPLPPYIHEPLADPERYQTRFAADRDETERSAAAPTAGLHLTPELLSACREAGADLGAVELRVGLDTFRPMGAEVVEEHRMHSEWYAVDAGLWERVRAAERVVAVGTTTVRTLETVAAGGALSGRTSLFIHGAYPFRAVDVLLTNFHLPRSSLLVMVEAFYGPCWRERYREALALGYRFLSFGDAMLLGRGEGRP